MDSGVWVFLGYFAVGIITLVAVAVVYFIFRIYPKVKAIVRILDNYVTNIKKSGEEISCVAEELEKIRELFKEALKK
jgi:F0F1-type ATP synthase membrane subunit b/b'